MVTHHLCPGLILGQAHMQLDLYSTGMVQKLIGKNKRTFNGLYDQYAGVLYGIICREVADRSVAAELLRQTFVLAWQQLGDYDREQDNILMWLIRRCCTVTQQYTGSRVDLTAQEAVAQSS